MKPFGLVFCSFILTSVAWSQCAPGIPSAGNPGCIPPNQSNSPYAQGEAVRQHAAPIQAVWADRWGAIAMDGNTGEAGTVVGYATQSEAVSAAIGDCSSKGAKNCKPLLIYHNQCAAVAQSTEGALNASGAPTLDEAKSLSIERCGQHGGKCNVVYSDCSYPVRVK
ncbi:DUF4189 domain-containing protein [Frateuria defendens]|uniref:DUF4189 domain-containing protein n=1 Tax=Frateuria defendens TaxID=2219559 RepID=UPI003CCCD2B7